MESLRAMHHHQIRQPYRMGAGPMPGQYNSMAPTDTIPIHLPLPQSNEQIPPQIYQRGPIPQVSEDILRRDIEDDKDESNL